MNILNILDLGKDSKARLIAGIVFFIFMVTVVTVGVFSDSPPGSVRSETVAEKAMHGRVLASLPALEPLLVVAQRDVAVSVENGSIILKNVTVKINGAEVRVPELVANGVDFGSLAQKK